MFIIIQKSIARRVTMEQGESTLAVPAYIALRIFVERKKPDRGRQPGRITKWLSQFVDRRWKPRLTCDVNA